MIITAGVPRKPGQSRDDLVGINLPIIRNVAENAKKHCPNAFTIVISNPLDAMVYEPSSSRTGFPKRQGGRHGRRARQRRASQLFLAREVGVSIKDVRAMVLGGHGDDMVPCSRLLHHQRRPGRATDLEPKDKLDAIIARTRGGGGEIVKLMGTSAYYAPATAAVAMAESYLLDQKRMLPARRTSTASTATRTSTSACPW
jgi:malate dehydrogenase